MYASKMCSHCSQKRRQKKKKKTEKMSVKDPNLIAEIINEEVKTPKYIKYMNH